MNLYASIKLLFFIIFGITIRCALRFSSYHNDIANRIEVSTPVASWKRAIEGVTLMNMKVSPYSGDTFHESPLFLHLYNYMVIYAKEWIPFIFITCDVFSAVFLFLGSYKQLKYMRFIEEKRLKLLKNTDEIDKLSLIQSDVTDLSLKIAAIYLLSPYSLLPCIGQSTSVFTTLLLSLIIYFSTCGFRVISMALLAILSYQSFYPIMLIVPLMMIIEQNRVLKDKDETLVHYSSSSVIFSMLLTFSIFVIFLLCLLMISCNLMANDWSFIMSTYGFLWTVPDLTPTIGLFWYFFTEMFDHFREFFLWTFQINAFIYVLPLSITLRNNPYFFQFTLLIILSLFKPYPSVSDFAIYTSLLPQWSHLFFHMKQGLLVTCVFICCSVLAPILWHLWIIMGTANSNFYFGVTLGYNTAQIFLVTDLLFAFTKREYYIKNGVVKDSKGNLMRLELSY